MNFFQAHISQYLVKRLALLIIALIVTPALFGAAAKTVYSIVSGASWTTNTHWSSSSGGGSCGCRPDESKDVIYIETNTTSASSLTFGSSVTVVVRNNSILTINGDVEFKNGSSISVEAGSQMIVNGNVSNKNNSTGISINGTLTVNGEFSAETGSTITGTGNLTTSGKATTAGTATVFGFANDCPSGPCFSNATTPLPVKLISFTADIEKNNVVLKWSTASEINNDHFVVEKSPNGTDFDILIQVKGSGNSNKTLNYTCSDNGVPQGTYYYRLKQVDFDGKFEYLEVIALSVVGEESSCDLFIKPNPCVGRCEVSFENCLEEEFQDAKIMLFDAVGNAVYTSVSKQVAGGRASFELDNNNNLRPAVYFVRGSVSNKQKAKRVVIAK